MQGLPGEEAHSEQFFTPDGISVRKTYDPQTGIRSERRISPDGSEQIIDSSPNGTRIIERALGRTTAARYMRFDRQGLPLCELIWDGRRPNSLYYHQRDPRIEGPNALGRVPLQNLSLYYAPDENGDINLQEATITIPERTERALAEEIPWQEALDWMLTHYDPASRDERMDRSLRILANRSARIAGMVAKRERVHIDAEQQQFLEEFSGELHGWIIRSLRPHMDGKNMVHIMRMLSDYGFSAFLYDQLATAYEHIITRSGVDADTSELTLLLMHLIHVRQEQLDMLSQGADQQHIVMPAEDTMNRMLDRCFSAFSHWLLWVDTRIRRDDHIVSIRTQEGRIGVERKQVRISQLPSGKVVQHVVIDERERIVRELPILGIGARFNMAEVGARLHVGCWEYDGSRRFRISFPHRGVDWRFTVTNDLPYLLFLKIRDGLCDPSHSVAGLSEMALAEFE